VRRSEAATGRNVCSQAYDAEVKDIFGVQEDIARRVVGAAAKLTRFERERALGKPTTNSPPMNTSCAVVRHSRTPHAKATTRRRKCSSVQSSSTRATPPYAALGLSLIEAVASGWTEFVADDLGRAENLAQKALSLDPSSTSAYRLLAEMI